MFDPVILTIVGFVLYIGLAMRIGRMIRNGGSTR